VWRTDCSQRSAKIRWCTYFLYSDFRPVQYVFVFYDFFDTSRQLTFHADRNVCLVVIYTYMYNNIVMCVQRDRRKLHSCYLFSLQHDSRSLVSIAFVEWPHAGRLVHFRVWHSDVIIIWYWITVKIARPSRFCTAVESKVRLIRRRRLWWSQLVSYVHSKITLF
jgi:hypothetical protein